MSEENSTVGFTVTPSFRNWPYNSFCEFKTFASQYAGDCYWVAVQILLERSKRLELYEAGEEVSPVEEKEDKPQRLTLGD